MVTLGVILVLAGLLYFAALKLRAPRKRCRFCSQEIPEDAMVCHHCDRDQL